MPATLDRQFYEIESFDEPESKPERPAFNTLEDILAWVPTPPDYYDERRLIRVRGLGPVAPDFRNISGYVATSRGEFDLGCEIKNFAFKISLSTAVESARSQLFDGHPFPEISSGLYIGKYGGVVTHFAYWNDNPMAVKSETVFTSDGKKVSLMRDITVQVRFPLPNPFNPRYELVAHEKHLFPDGTIHSERESVLIRHNDHFEFARLLCRYRAIMEEFDWLWNILEYRPKEIFYNAADSDETLRNAYLDYWGKRGFRIWP